MSLGWRLLGHRQLGQMTKFRHGSSLDQQELSGLRSGALGARPDHRKELQDEPLAVVRAALGQYGGVWAHDESRESFGIAGRPGGRGPQPVGTAVFQGKHPRENAEVAQALRDIVGKLAAEVG